MLINLAQQPFHPSLSSSSTAGGPTVSRRTLPTAQPIHRQVDVLDHHECVQMAARVLLQQMQGIGACTDHSKDTPGAQAEQLASELRRDGQFTTSLDDISFRVQNLVNRPLSDVFTIGAMHTADTIPSLTPEQWQMMSCGVASMDPGSDVPKQAPVLSMVGSQPDDILFGGAPQVEPLIRWDIDSILGIPTSLAVAQQGLQFTMTPQFKRNITKDLHVTLRIPTSNLDSSPLINAAIREIPHFQLGWLCGDMNISLYAFVPAWYDDKKKTNFPSGQQLARFYDKLFLPAIYRHSQSDLLQHLPHSYQGASRESLAGSAERLSFKSSHRVQDIR